MTDFHPHHAVLLGDSIFDNAAYVAGGPDVAAQLRTELGPEWKTTLLAVDGDTTAGIGRQLHSLPPDATHLVVSVGGNDALGYVGLLTEGAETVAGALAKLAAARDTFAAGYAGMIEQLAAVGLPTAVCTIYDTPASAPNHQVIKTALAIFNDSITRAAFTAGFTLVDLRLVCSDDGDYANPIEPSVQGGQKIAAAVAAHLVAGRPARRGAVVAGTWPAPEPVGPPL